MQTFCTVREGVRIKMLNRSMGVTFAVTVVLASLPAAFAQDGKQGQQKGKAPTSSNKPFDPHDLSGFWEITKTGLPSGALNETSNNRPPMTPWGTERFRKTKTG